MTTIEPDLGSECCDDDIVEGYPDQKPPCTKDTCSFVWSTLREAGGFLAGKVRLRGGSKTKQVGDDCVNEEDCGVLRCFIDRDGNPQGIDVDLAGDPANLEGVDCQDEDGNDLYVNPLRRIKNDDGSCSLGALPFPTQDIVCAEVEGCSTLAPAGAEGDVFDGCNKQVCSTIKNESCYPMIVVPKATIEGAALGAAPVQYELQPNVNGNFESKIPVFSSGGGGCSVVHVPGDSVGHNVQCPESGETHSGTIEFAPVEIAAGDSFTFCVKPSLRYTGETEDPFAVDYGTIRVCLDGRSKVTAETIAALEGTS